MKYSIRVNEVKSKEGNVRGFATVVFGDSFKITNIAILENTERGQLFVSMPRYKTNERDENGGYVFKDVCNPITKEFREELYANILEAYENLQVRDQEPDAAGQSPTEMPAFSVTVTPFEKEGSNIRGLAHIYLEDSFIVNNVNILQGKERIFVAMPAYRTNQTDEQGKTVYQDICYPVTKEFREKLYSEVLRCYEEEKKKMQDQDRSKQSKTKGIKGGSKQSKNKETPLR